MSGRAKSTNNRKVEMDRILKLSIIKPWQTEWAAPVVFSPNEGPDSSLLCRLRPSQYSFRQDSYPIPRIEECIDSLGDASKFSILDANSGYWQIEIKERDHANTAFIYHHGLHPFKCMPFGQKNPLSTFNQPWT